MQWIKIIFVGCLVTLSFVLGAAALFWNVSPASALREKFGLIESALVAAKTLPTTNVALDMDAVLGDKSVTWKKPQALEGYTAITMRYRESAYLLDMQGKVVHGWNMPFNTAFPSHPHVKNTSAKSHIYFEKAHVFPNGDLLATYTGWLDTPYGYGIVKMDKDSRILWTYADNTHHDIFIPTEGSALYTLTHQFVQGTTQPILVDYIALLSSDGRLIKKISVLDAFTNSDFRGLLTNRQPQGAAWDIFHTNSIDVITPDKAAAFPQFPVGSILISIRNMNTVAVIDPETTKVIWAYSGIWAAQHAAHFTDHGTIIVLDNNGGGTPDNMQSRIMEIHPSTLAVSANYTGTPSAPFHSCAYGRLQSLSNGNMLVTETLGSRIFEINAANQIVWSYKLKPFYQPHVVDIAPYGKNEKNYDPDFLCALPNLGTAIVYAERYTPEQLPFLKEAVQ